MDDVVPRSSSPGVVVSFFLIASIGAGTLFALFTPPFEVPDEPSHFFRAWAISEGHLLAERRGGVSGWMLPPELPDLVRATADGVPGIGAARVPTGAIATARKGAAAGEARVFVVPGGTLIPFVPYLPQAAGVLAGRLAGASPLSCLFLARIANVVAASLLVAGALAVLTRGRWLLTLAALLPMATFLRGSASPDAATLGLAFLCAAFTAHSLTVPTASPARRRAAVVLSLLFALTKPPYALAAAVVSLIPGSRRSRAALGLLLAGLVGAGLAGAAAFPLAPRGDAPTAPGIQVVHVLRHPVETGAAVSGDMVRHAARYGAEAIGRLGWLDVALPRWVLWGTAAVLLLLLFADPPVPLGARGRAVFLAAVGCSAAAVVLSQYVTWTPVGSGRVEGVQGRYFLPLVPLLLLGAAPAGKVRRAAPFVCVAAALLANGIALDAVVRRYYAGGWREALSLWLS